MKIQIIKLEKHDDVISAQDKLAWGKTARLLLLLPGNGRILTRRIDLVILQRYCDAQGSQLGLVTHDPMVKENANFVGIPIFSTETEALKGHWSKRKPRRVHEAHGLPDLRSTRAELRTLFRNETSSKQARWNEKGWARIAFFSAAVISVIALAGAFFPSAAIDVSPMTKTQTVILPLVASSQIKSVNISGSLPARTITAVVEEQDKIPVSGSIMIADQFAFGGVQFTNLGNQAVNIPAGTILDSVQGRETRFVTTTNGSLDAGLGKTASIPIRAIKPGIDGNSPAGAIGAIEGALGLQVSVNNLYPTTGGTEKKVPAVNANDYEELRSRIIANLKRTAINQFLAKLAPGDQFVLDSLITNDILDEESSPGINQPADYLSISLRIEYSGLYISNDDLKLIGTLNLDAGLEYNFSPVSGSMIIEAVDIPQIGADQVVQAKIEVSRMIQMILPGEQLAATILGMTPAAASRKLVKYFQLKSQPTINLTPAWWPQIPILAFRITIFQGNHADSGG